MRTAILLALALTACRRPLAPGETRCVQIANGVTKCKSGPPVQADAGR